MAGQTIQAVGCYEPGAEDFENVVFISDRQFAVIKFLTTMLSINAQSSSGKCIFWDSRSTKPDTFEWDDDGVEARDPKAMGVGSVYGRNEH